LTRSSLLTFCLIVAIGLVLTKNILAVDDRPWDLPNPGKAKSPILVEGSKPVTNRQRSSGRRPLSARIFLTRNEERVLPGKRRRIPRRFNAYEAWCYWALRSLGITDLPSCRMERFLLEHRESPANRLRRCASKLGDTVEGFRLSEVSEKKELFSPEVPRR